MKRFTLVVFVLVFALFASVVAAFAQGPKKRALSRANSVSAVVPVFSPIDTDRPDPLGLETRSVEVAGRIPVVVTGAVEASQLSQVRGFLFGGGKSYGRTELGNNIQSMVSDAMLDVGYNSLLPRTGFQGQSRTLADAEISLFANSADYAVVPEISFITAQSSQKSVDLEPVGRTIGREIGGTAGRIIRDATNDLGIESGKGMVEVLLTLRLYDRAGQQVRHYSAVEKIEWEVYKTFQSAIIKTGTTNSPTLTPLARKLVDAVVAKMPR